MKSVIRKQIDLYPTREPAQVVDPVVLVLRQTVWGERNGETRIELHAVEKDGDQYCVASGVALRGTLLSLAHVILDLVGESELANQLAIPNRPSAVRHPRIDAGDMGEFPEEIER